MNEWLLLLGLAVFTLACRSFRHKFFKRLWLLGLLATSFGAAWLLTGHPVGGLLGLLLWPALPWIELLTRVRSLRLPARHHIRPMPPPSAGVFPALADLTAEAESEGFEFLRDVGWEWRQFRHTFRLLYRPDDRALAAICLATQDSLSFYYLSISSRDQSGRTWVTWNYPFPPSLKHSPDLRLNPQPGDITFFDMYQNHIGFLLLNRVRFEDLTPLDETTAIEILAREHQRELDHNLRAGILKRVDGDSVAYSLRGLFYLWAQLMFHFLRAR